jgi:hypothetical protein
MGFDPCHHSLKIQESIRTPTPKMGAHLGVGVFILSHPPTFSTSWEHEMWFPSFILLHSQSPRSTKCDSQISLLARTLVSPCLGHEPKAKVVTVVKVTLWVLKIRYIGLWRNKCILLKFNCITLQRD